MDTIILQGLKVEQLLSYIEMTIEKTINKKLEQIQTTPPTKYLTRKEVATELHVNLPTLHEWTKLGYIKSYRIGTRVLFKSDELHASLRERKFRR